MTSRPARIAIAACAEVGAMVEKMAPAFHRDPAAAGVGQTGSGYFAGAENGPRTQERCLPGCRQKRAFASPVPAGEGR
jgi:hypothetical protein